MKKTYTVAIAGKGGSGKTTLTALIVRYLLRAKRTPVLAVDADPNSNLDELLGVESERTVVSTLDEVMDKRGELPPGVTKTSYLEYQLDEVLIESKGFDLLVMGRTEGPGCYCYANNLLRNLLDRLRGSYPYMVMDNEAGMEHLSRRTTRDADVLLIVANPAAVSLRSAKRIYALARGLKLEIGRAFLVLNNILPHSDTRSELCSLTEGRVEGRDLELLAHIPYDEEVARRSIYGKPLLDLEGDTLAIKAVEEMMGKILGGR